MINAGGQGKGACGWVTLAYPEPVGVASPAEGFCDFPMLTELTGKIKTIELSDGSLLTAPLSCRPAQPILS